VGAQAPAFHNNNKEKVMPKVGNKKFPYTAKGKSAAKAEAKKRGMSDVDKATFDYMKAKSYSLKKDKSAEMRRRVGRAEQILDKKWSESQKPATKAKSPVAARKKVMPKRKQKKTKNY
jgi:hypothetical protein